MNSDSETENAILVRVLGAMEKIKREKLLNPESLQSKSKNRQPPSKSESETEVCRL